MSNDLLFTERVKDLMRKGLSEQQALQKLMASHVPGQIEKGNLDPSAQKNAINEDGSVSTVRSMSFEDDGKEVLVPTVGPDGQLLSDDEAKALYHKTGKHLGIFRTPEDADAYAQQLHEDEARRIGPVMKPVRSH